MNNVKKDAVAPAGTIEKVEIMPADAVQVADYEQSSVKPPRIQQIEQYIQKRKDELDVLDGRIARIEKQRPDLAFKNDTAKLSELEKRLAEIENERKVSHDQVVGAEAELKREVKKWISVAINKRQKEKKELEIEYDNIKKSVQKHLDAISEIEGTTAMLNIGAYRSDRIKEQLKFGRYNDFGDIKKAIQRLMEM